MPHDIDQILEKLAKDVELAVHALYRGDVRQDTAQARTGHLVQQARAAVTAAIGRASGSIAPAQVPSPGAPSPLPSVAAPAVAGAAIGWTHEDSDAVLKCITAWLSMDAPNAAAPDTKCIPAGKMLLPTWGERERAREAVKRIS